MKKITTLLIVAAILALLISGCGKSKPADTQITPSVGPYVAITVYFNPQDGIATNQYAVWIEDSSGDLVKSVFATHFTADGGWEKRPEALPVWVEKSGLSAGTAQNIDTYTGATPKEAGRQVYYWDCTDENGQTVPDGDYRFITEGIIYWADAVTFSGTIHVGGDENTTQAEAQYTTDKATGSDMISGVDAAYTP